MKKYQPSKTALNFIRVILLIVFSALTVADFYFLSDLTLPILMWTLAGIFASATLFLCLVYLPLYFKSAVYFVSPSEISKNSGVFFKTRQLMKFSAVQYTTEIISPLSKLTALNFLILNALGGRMMLSCLSKSDIQEITASISASIRKRGEKQG